MALQVYYDGACYLCSMEINHYRALDPQGQKLVLVDIARPGFDAQAQDLDPIAVQRVMHVRGEDGRLLTAVDAFIAIWMRFDGYRTAARIAGLPWVKPVLMAAYIAFAKIRVYLPKRKYCDDGTCYR